MYEVYSGWRTESNALRAEAVLAIPRWDLFPRVADHPHGREWLQTLADLQRARNTIDAYGRSLETFLGWCAAQSVDAVQASKFHIVQFLAYQRGNGTLLNLQTRAEVSLSTLQVRLSALRGFYDHLVEDGLRQQNPIGRGRYSPASPKGAKRGLLPRPKRLPWIPTDEQWEAFLLAAQAASLRDRLMLALAYCGALRREEVCDVDLDRLDVARRLIEIPAMKSREPRIVGYSSAADPLLAAYLAQRRASVREAGALFRSSSNRNRGAPLSPWSWNKTVQRLARRAGLPRFSTHTFRHLRLTHLARAGWQIHEIMKYAGHQQAETTMIYIHLSGRDVEAKFARTLQSVDRRLARLAEQL